MDEGLRSWRQVQWCVLQGRWRGALEALPLWPVSWLLAVLACALWLLWPAGGQPIVPGAAQLAALATAQLLRDAALATGFSLLAGRIKSPLAAFAVTDRKSTRLNSSHLVISYAVFCLKKQT